MKNIKIDLNDIVTISFIDKESNKLNHNNTLTHNIFEEDIKANDLSIYYNNIVKVDKIPFRYNLKVDYYEDDEIIKLKQVEYSIIEENNKLYLLIDKENMKENIFNKKDFSYIENFDLIDSIEFVTNRKYQTTIDDVSDYSCKNIIIFLLKVIKEKSDDLYKNLQSYYSSKEIKRYNTKSIPEVFNNKIILSNLYNIALKSTSVFEEIMNINTDLIFSNIDNEILDFNINNNNDEGNLLSLPAFVLDYINKNNYGELLINLQDLQIKDEEYKVLIDFFKNSDVLVASNIRNKTFNNFTKYLNKIYKYHKYDLKELLNYLIKESLFNKSNFNSLFDEEGDCILFTFPLNEAKKLSHYLEMMSVLKLEHNKFPDLVEDYYLIKNEYNEIIDYLSDKLDIIKESRDLIKTFENDKYSLIYPNDKYELIKYALELKLPLKAYINRSNNLLFFVKSKESNKIISAVELTKFKNIYSISNNKSIIKPILLDWLKTNR